MATALEWLDEHGAGDVPHPGGTLVAHLVRVADRLAAWGSPEAVRLAGLTHAAYGTAGFDDQLIGPERRAELRAVVGAEAEGLVYQYGACDRSTSYPQFAGTEPFLLDDRFGGESMRLTAGQTRAFVSLTFANEIDVMQHNTELADRHGAALYDLALASTYWLPRTAFGDLSLLRRESAED